MKSVSVTHLWLHTAERSSEMKVSGVSAGLESFLIVAEIAFVWVGWLVHNIDSVFFR